MPINIPSLKALPIALLVAGLNQTYIHGQQAQFTPIDVGQTVNGFQDDFTGAARDPNWIPLGPGGDLYEQANGVLKVTVTEGDPNHLLYQAPGYNDAAQEVLARIRATAFGTGDFPRGGIGVGVNGDTSQGIELHFRDSDQDGVSGRQFKLLDDLRAWGPPGLKTVWEDNAWYWLRLRQTGSSSSAGPNIFAKAWPADGSVPEPDDWQMTWARDGRTGFAGITGSSGFGLGEFEVDYVLVKAEGLPSIKVAPSASPIPFFVSITEQPRDVSVGLNQIATLTAQAASSSPAAFQWQRAAPGSSTFSDIAGATTATLTTAALKAADEGAKYRVVVSLPGTSTTTTSREATVHVDSTVPTVAFARTLGNPTKVTIAFSEAVTAPGGAANFSIDNGVTISALAQGSTPNTFELTTSALSAGTTYTLTVNGVRDSFANEILANTKATIDLSIEVPIEFGQTVNGYQDDFDAATRNPLWLPEPPDKDSYEQAGGLLKVTVVGDNPGLDTHLLYSAPGYSDTVQEVLARIRITNFGKGDAARCGLAVAVDPDSSQGINLHFRDNNQDGVLGRQFKLLDDRRAWGPAGYDLDWENNIWYWLRLRQTGPSAPDNLNGKVWKADGTEAEPDQWQLNWGRDGRAGLAGIVGSSIGGISEFEVDYILIKAEGLPAVKVTPGAFAFGPFINITQQPTNAVVPPGQNVTLTVAATGSSAPTFQWQKASAGTSNFADVTGANASTLTIPAPTEAENGAKYRAVVSVAGLSKMSREAAIITDVTPPTLVSARTLGNPNKVTVTFSEDVGAVAASASFAIDNGVTITGTAPGLTPNVIELTTSTIALGKDYNLTVSGVSDLFNNTILPDSKIAINLFVELPVDFGQTVNGFQDDFTGAVRDPNWISVGVGDDLYVQADGVLKIPTFTGDPNHLLYEAPGYDQVVQEVLARMRVTAFEFSAGGLTRGGIAVGSDPDNSHPGQALNLHFRDTDATGPVHGRHVGLLDDYIAWGPQLDFKWINNAWYWLRLRQTGSAAAGGNRLLAKFWAADGTVPEPSDWQITWARSEHSGFAGLTGGSGGLSEFEVDYVLIKATGLPSTKVAATAFALIGPSPIALKFTGLTRTAGNTFSLEWTGTGVLEQADSVIGPWTVVTPATSPLTITASGGAKFYRLHQ